VIGLVLPILLATLLALARGGSLDGWARQPVCWWPAILVAFAVQLALFNPPLNEQAWAITGGPAIWVASMLAVALVLVRNGLVRRVARFAWLVAALGVCLNVLVVAANGGYMPRGAEASAVVGRPIAAESGQRLRNVAPLATETRLGWLGDVIPQPAWLPLANVVSLGDLLLSGGAAWWAFQATASGQRRPTVPAGEMTAGRRPGQRQPD
jgi:hypothetical protein